MNTINLKELKNIFNENNLDFEIIEKSINSINKVIIGNKRIIIEYKNTNLSYAATILKNNIHYIYTEYNCNNKENHIIIGTKINNNKEQLFYTTYYNKHNKPYMNLIQTFKDKSFEEQIILYNPNKKKINYNIKKRKNKNIYKNSKGKTIFYFNKYKKLVKQKFISKNFTESIIFNNNNNIIYKCLIYKNYIIETYYLYDKDNNLYLKHKKIFNKKTHKLIKTKEINRNIYYKFIQ